MTTTDYPTIELASPFGDIKFTLYSKTNGVASSDLLRVNGVAYKLRLYFKLLQRNEKTDNGEVGPYAWFDPQGGYGSLQREGKHGFATTDGVSDKARAKVTTFVFDTALELLQDTSVTTVAHKHSIQTLLDRQNGVVMELEKKLQEAIARADELQTHVNSEEPFCELSEKYRNEKCVRPQKHSGKCLFGNR